MNTVVYQSFRTNNVSAWITTCLESTSKWAKMKGFDYLFYDDDFFNYAPAALRKAVKDQRHLVSDSARIELAAELLKTYDRVIWVDADVYINNPTSFLQNPPESSFLFCKERWMHKEHQKLNVIERVNNAVMVLER